MTVDTAKEPIAPQIAIQPLAPAGPNSKVCGTCGHTLAKAVVCGRPEKCTSGRYEEHYHCIANGKKLCCLLGECQPIEDERMRKFK